MNSILKRLLNLLVSEKPRSAGMLAGFMDSLLQKFENCRTGLADNTIQQGAEAVQEFFADLYEKEVPRLQEVIRIQEMHHSETLRRNFFETIDALARKVVIPGYTRLAGPFTRRERNDFYWLSEPLHGLERLGWGAVGLGLGAIVVWAPFIPLWSKEWCLVFAVGGLVFPNARQFLSLRRYESELNRLAARADDEIRRIEQTYYLMSEEALGHRAGPSGQPEVTARRSSRPKNGKGGR
ncbi:MAG: hypothetical protein HYR55_11670 [Acidobacteria bacterium]|nr:hypothetical protein [Acidobacteriota bacterium]MBI3657247.1 hypothetical protein [Acidobacteriota bacterium]